MARVIFHVDLNAFFASAEEIKNPSLKGKPVAVGSMSKRGVLSTANYKAREYGVHSAMPVYMALEKCPELIIVQGDYNYYRSLSRQFFAYLNRFTHQIEPASIDECYMDVTEVIRKYPRPMDLAFQIQDGVYQELGLTVSIGVAPTKFLAKMASDMRKPQGITILRKSDIPLKLWPLPIDDLYGIGKKTAPILKEKGIKTIGDFAAPENQETVLKITGKSGYGLLQCVYGKSSDQLSFSTTQKSISISRTYAVDIYTMEELLTKIRSLVDELSKKMIRDNQMGKQISLTLRDTEFHNAVRSTTLDHYTNSYPQILQAVENLADQYFEPIGYRHIGIHVGSLKYADQIVEQISLFETPIQNTDMIVERLNRSIDSKVFMKGSDLLKKDKND